MFDKRGEERILSIWWFVVVVILSVVIVMTSSSYFSTEVNTKAVETEILYNFLAECLIENGHLVNISEPSFDIYQNCSLKKDLFEDGSDYYFEINDSDSVLFSGGQLSYKTDCEVLKDGSVTGEHYPACFYRIEKVMYNSEKIDLYFLVATNQNIQGFFGGKNNA